MTRVATFTRLSRTGYGFDSGTLSEVAPCNLMPEAWDLDRRTSPGRRYTTAHHAVLACYSCPVLSWCIRQPPPEHDCVQAGRVWWRRRWYDLPQFHRLTGEDIS